MSWRDAVPRDATNSRASSAPRLRYPRSCRLLATADFEAVYRHGRRRAGRSFAVFCRPNGRDLSRFGMSVKKALGGAVVRNRIRRRIREILRIHRPEIASGWDIVIHPRTSVASADFSALAQELLQLLPSDAAPPASREPSQEAPR
ncbi:MAG: ribonuclease P protein component [Candidatus Acidiferrales bacterium]